MNSYNLNPRHQSVSDFRKCYEGKRVLVTGHTGFKGAWLSLWLLELGADVTGLSLAPESNLGIFAATGLGQRMQSLIGDIRRPEDIESAFAAGSPEIVFHLAAQPIVGSSYEDPLNTFDTNAMGTARILDAARRQSNLRAVVVVTSDKCYENTGSLWGHRETDPLGGDDPYSASKACAELITSSFRASFCSGPEGPALASARAGNVIGGGDWGEFRLIPDCIRALRGGNLIHIRNPHYTRPFQFVLDALGGYLLLGANLLREDSARFSSGWNFGPANKAHTVLEAAEGVVRSWGDGTVEHTATESFSEKSLLKLDSSKSLELLNWNTSLDFQASIHWTVEWYRHQLENNDADMLTFSQEMISRFESIAPYFKSNVTQ